MSYHKFKSVCSNCAGTGDGPFPKERCLVCNGSGEVKYGSFEVFYNASLDTGFVLDPEDKSAEPAPIGWYWWACFPGCLPDGDPHGPYESEEEAIQMAQDCA